MVLTGGLYANRVRTTSAIASAPSTNTPSEAAAPSRRKAERVVEEPAKQPVDEPVIETRYEPVEESVSELAIEPEQQEEFVQREELEVVEEETESVEAEPEPEFVPEPLVVEEVIEDVVEDQPAELIEEIADEPADVIVDELVDEMATDNFAIPDVIPEPEVIEVVEESPPPTFEQLPDGSFKIIATDTIIPGTGTQANPYIVDWKTLRSIERGYNPKKGKNDLPDWLDVLDEMHVRIVGNTLVPVIATTTRELLVMQNPWDGCCVGIPPSPYDAIEVSLNHDVDFGASAVGYGTVEGVFILDPYVVDGWVLGIYIIEEAKYRSGDGIAFPDF